MRLANFEMENVINFTSDKASVLVLESPSKYYQFCNMLLKQSKGEDGKFVLSERFTEINFAKNVYIISNLFNIENYERKLVNSLYTDLNSILNESHFQQFNEINAQIINLLEKLSFDSDFSLNFETMLNFDSLLKMQKVNFLKEKESFIEELIDHLLAVNRYIKPKLIIIFGLKTVLSNGELDEFYKIVRHSSTKLLLIESHYKNKRDDENVLLIDNDLCELTF